MPAKTTPTMSKSKASIQMLLRDSVDTHEGNRVLKNADDRKGLIV